MLKLINLFFLLFLHVEQIKIRYCFARFQTYHIFFCGRLLILTMYQLHYTENALSYSVQENLADPVLFSRKKVGIYLLQERHIFSCRSVVNTVNLEAHLHNSIKVFVFSNSVPLHTENTFSPNILQETNINLTKFYYYELNFKL